jgi:hypothetical protein
MNDRGQENFIYDGTGRCIPRRIPKPSETDKSCGVLVNLHNIQALFDPYVSYEHDHGDDSESLDLADPEGVNVDVYPLGFLRTAGNVQADGIPPCFYELITNINKSVRKPAFEDAGASGESSGSGDSEAEVAMTVDSDEEIEGSGGRRGRRVRFVEVEETSEDSDAMSVDMDEGDGTGRDSRVQVVRPVSAQFYNYIAHRVAARAGGHDSQQGAVTGAISGGFANSRKHKATAKEKQLYCKSGLPSDRFHKKSSQVESPTSCRAEMVYSIDVRALEDPSGRQATLFPFLFFSFPFHSILFFWFLFFPLCCLRYSTLLYVHVRQIHIHEHRA